MADETRTLVVEFKGDARGLSRTARRAADDVEDASRRMSRTGPMIQAGLSPFLDNDIAEVVGSSLAKIPPPALAAAGALAAVTVAAAGTAAIGGAAGAALAVVGSWLYGRDPTSPLGVAVDDVKDAFGNLANTLDSVVRPVFDDLATAWGPIVIDMIHDLSDWLVNNRETVRDWILTLGRAFTQGAIVATYFGQALIVLSTSGVLVVTNAIGALTTAMGYLLQASGYLAGSQGMQAAGKSFVDAGKNAMAMSDDIVEAGIAGNDAMIAIRDGAKEADKALDEMEGTRKVTVVYSSEGFAEIRRQGDQLAGAIRPHSASYAAGPSSRSAPVVNVTVNSLLADTAMVRTLEPTFRKVLAEIDRRNGAR